MLPPQMLLMLRLSAAAIVSLSLILLAAAFHADDVYVSRYIISLFAAAIATLIFADAFAAAATLCAVTI